MPSRWQREYSCDRCAALITDWAHVRVVGWSRIAHAQGTFYRLCDRCMDDLRTWINSARFGELWSVRPEP